MPILQSDKKLLRMKRDRKRIAIILPDGRIHRINVWPFTTSFREAPLTATILAALVPEDLPIDVVIRDESVGQSPYVHDVDLVGISVLTGTAYRAYEIARYYRQRGVKVVLGGVHVTLLPEEAAQHADSIVIGFAEETWPELLRDFIHGRLQPRYVENKATNKFCGIPMARRDLQKRFGYLAPNTVSATRGCKAKCKFCAVPAANFGWQTRPIPEVIDEIKSMNARRIVFNDVSMGEDLLYFKELLHALIPLNIKWGGLASTKVFRDPEIPELLQKSGCSYLLIGFESVRSNSLKDIQKQFNKIENYQYIIQQLRNIDVILMGTFIFGVDSDDEHVFEETVDFVLTNGIDIPRYAIVTPYPKTPLFEELKSQNRILHEYWPHYDTQHVVFEPARMSPEQLDRGFRWAYRETFRVGHILRRMRGRGKNLLITLAGNLAYRIYLRRLFRDIDRIRRPQHTVALS